MVSTKSLLSFTGYRWLNQGGRGPLTFHKEGASIYINHLELLQCPPPHTHTLFKLSLAY